MNEKKQYKWLLIIFVIWPILDILLSLKEINVPLIRYAIYTIGTFQILKLYQNSYKSVEALKGLPKLLFSFALLWLILRFIASLADVVNGFDNYINFKMLLSGELILFFSFYIANSRMPLQYFKLFLKMGYILAVVFLIVAIPLFGYFTANILNNAELLIKYTFSGSLFLLLLFPYQRSKINWILSIGFILSLLIMLIIARRNVVLYLGSALFFLALVIIFSKCDLIKDRKPVLVAGAVVAVASILVFVTTIELNFNLFFERAETGMESREDVFLEFQEDFNAQPLDWLIGRGMFGSFYSMIGNENNHQRTLIENGYYHSILKYGLFFLIPFVLVSITAIINGFFRSKNHLSKAAAILIIVNLIDMVGYGLPFLGLKYLNLLIAFGFCFSPNIRKMNDFEIKKIIRL